MRIKIIGDNNCARATRHLLRLGGFAVTEYLPADALAGGPLAGYAITIDLAPANQTPDSCLRPDLPTLDAQSSTREEAARSVRDASSPACGDGLDDGALGDGAVGGGVSGGGSRIHFDSVDSELEAAVLRHVRQLAAAPVVVDPRGGLVHSDRELRIVVPNSGDAAADDAAAVAVEFGVLRGLLDLTAASGGRRGRGGAVTGGDRSEDRGDERGASRAAGWRPRWWPFAVVLLFGGLVFFRAVHARTVEIAPVVRGSVLRSAGVAGSRMPVLVARGEKSVLLETRAFALAQGQFDTGQGLKITDGNNFLVVDPCAGQTKLFASISQTTNTQLVAGTVSRKIYVCSIHLVAAAATNVAVVEGTGSVCGTGTVGVSGFGGATAATGWNFAANGGIALGNGASALGAEGNSGDNLCLFNSGSGQVSGGISYVVQ